MDTAIAVTVATGHLRPDDPAILSTNDVHVRVEPHPQLTAALQAAGARRRGPLAFSYPASAGHRPLQVALELVGPAVIGHRHARRHGGREPRLSRLGADRQATGILEQIDGTRGADRIRRILETTPPFPRQEETARGAGVIVVHRTRSGTWLRLHTHRLGGDGTHPGTLLHTHPVGGDEATNVPVDGHTAVTALRWLRTHRPGIPIVDSDGFGRTRADAPLLAAGALAAAGADLADLAEHLDVDLATARRIRAATTRVVPQLIATAKHSVAIVRAGPRLDLGAVTAGWDLPDDIAVPGPGHVGVGSLTLVDLDHPNIHVDDDLIDAHRMQTAAPADHDGLYDYQRAAAGMLAASRRGMLNTSAAGTGKTAMTAAGLAATASQHDRYRALIVGPASVRTQWAQALDRWAPDLPAMTVTSGRQADDVGRWLDSHDGAGVVVTSYTLLTGDSPLRHVLDGVDWHDVVADEVVGLTRPTKVGDALWQLRGRARRGLVLTATPQAGGRDITGPLAAWARNDRTLSDADADWVAPAVFQAPDDSNTLPSSTFTVEPVTPDGLAADAIRHAAGTLARADDGPERTAAQRRLVAATALARCLADPTGQVDARQARVVDLARERATSDVPTLVFCDSGDVARRLSDLLAPHVTVGLLDGSTERDRVATRWQDGHYQVLVVAPAGQRGVNLQRPGARQQVIHADIPWDAGRVVQRNGRAVRVGGADQVDIVAVVWAGTVEQQVADAVAAGEDPGTWVQLAAAA